MKIRIPFAAAAIAASALLPAGAGAAIVEPHPVNPTVVTPQTVTPSPAPKIAPAPSATADASAPAPVSAGPAPASQASGGSADTAGGYPRADDPAEKRPDPAAGEIRVSQLQFEIAVERALHNAGWPTVIFDGQPTVPSPAASTQDAGVPAAGAPGDGVGDLLDAIDALFGTSLHRSLDEGTPQQEQ